MSTALKEMRSNHHEVREAFNRYETEEPRFD